MQTIEYCTDPEKAAKIAEMIENVRLKKSPWELFQCPGCQRTLRIAPPTGAHAGDEPVVTPSGTCLGSGSGTS